jgi:hypothetical protein
MTFLLMLLMLAQDQTYRAYLPCDSVTPLFMEFHQHGGAQDVVITGNSGCSWVALKTGEAEGWVFFQGETSKTGSGVFAIVTSPNSGPARRGGVRVGGQLIIITQKGRGK